MLRIDLTSKRARLALRFFTYGVMTLATILLTLLAVFYAMGYRLNQDELTFEQGGLLQFRTNPAGAQVQIDDALQSFTTPGRANLGAGTHSVQMKLDGYHTWQKTVNLAPGQLLWLNYARLLPTTITTTGIANFSNVTAAMASPNRTWMVLSEHTNQPSFKLADFSDEQKPVITQLAIPESQVTKKNDAYGQFTIKEWDLGSRFILIEHINGDAREFIRLDRQNANAAINISRLFSLAIHEAHFAGSNPNILFAKTDSVLRRVDIGSNVASAVLISGVDSFAVYGNETISFVATRNTTEGDDGSRRRLAGIYEDDKETVISTYDPATNIKATYTEYARHAYFAVEDGKGVVKIWRDPTTDSSQETSDFAQFDLGTPISWLQFSGNGRMLAVGSGKTLATYDIELAKTTRWIYAHGELTRPLQWLDDYYLWADVGDRLRIFEFDNTNGGDITAVMQGLAASLSPDGAYVYSFKRDASGVQLQSSQVVRNP